MNYPPSPKGKAYVVLFLGHMTSHPQETGALASVHLDAQ